MRVPYVGKIVSSVSQQCRRRFCNATPVAFSASYDRIFLHEKYAQGEHHSWSETLSYAAPESDFVGKAGLGDNVEANPEWSKTLSYATPESDFVASHQTEARDLTSSLNEQAFDFAFLSSQPETALGFTYTSEELDSSMKNALLRQQGFVHQVEESSNKNSFLESDEALLGFGMLSSPESAAGFIHAAEVLTQSGKDDLQTVGQVEQAEYVPNQNTYMTNDEALLGFGMLSSPESAAGFIHAAEILTQSGKDDLQVVESKIDELPKTLEEALKDTRAIVVTAASSPFDIVDVNDAWVGLCGYTRGEAKNKNLGTLLQGPETSVREARNLISRLKRDHYGEALITNYAKDGRKFTNHVKVGVLSESEEENARKFFVGVLTEMNDSEKMQASM